jgi:hypothetical protein
MNCPHCQMANPEGAKFCLNCGNRLEAQFRVDGERRYVTVLFADVVDSPRPHLRVPRTDGDLRGGATT